MLSFNDSHIEFPLQASYVVLILAKNANNALFPGMNYTIIIHFFTDEQTSLCRIGKLQLYVIFLAKQLADVGLLKQRGK